MTASRDELRGIPLFATLSDEGLDRVAALATASDVGAGHVLVEVGHPASGLFILQAGRVAVEVPDRDPIEYGPGAFFGELALLTDHPRTARVRTTEPSTILALARSDVQDLLATEPSIALGMLRGLAERLIDSSD